MAGTRNTGAAKAAASRAGKRSTAAGRSGRAGAKRKASAIRSASAKLELDKEAARLLSEYDNLLSEEQIDDHGQVRRVLRLKGWPDAHKREQTHAVILGNVRSNLEIRQLRGSLIPREEATKAAEDVRDAFMAAMPSFGRSVADQIEGLTAKQRRELVKACDQSLRSILEAAVEAAGDGK